LFHCLESELYGVESDTTADNMAYSCADFSA